MLRNAGRKGLILVVACAAALLSACSSYTYFEVKGTSVKNMKPSPEEVARTEALQKAKDAEIAAMASVRENSVFTERNGKTEYLIGPGDILKLTYWEGAKHTDYETEVRADGKISYSFLDDVPVSGRTVAEVHRALTEGLKSYIRNPRLELVVKEYRSKPVLLYGQINRLAGGGPNIQSGPGKYGLRGKTTVLDLIVTAGGPVTGRSGGFAGSGRLQLITGDAEGNADMRNVELIRKGKSHTLNLYDALYKGEHNQNVVLDAGDIVQVPVLSIFGDKIYVLGEVEFQGIYRLKDAPDLLSALTIAGTPTRLAVKSDIKVIRGYPERRDNLIVLSTSYDDITKKAKLFENIDLQANDVIWVPRTTIGDINEFIVNSVPLLDYMFYPARYRDAYGNPDAMRLK